MFAHRTLRSALRLATVACMLAGLGIAGHASAEVVEGSYRLPNGNIDLDNDYLTGSARADAAVILTRARGFFGSGTPIGRIYAASVARGELFGHGGELARAELGAADEMGGQNGYVRLSVGGNSVFSTNNWHMFVNQNHYSRLARYSRTFYTSGYPVRVTLSAYGNLHAMGEVAGFRNNLMVTGRPFVSATVTGSASINIGFARATARGSVMLARLGSDTFMRLRNLHFDPRYEARGHGEAGALSGELSVDGHIFGAGFDIPIYDWAGLTDRRQFFDEAGRIGFN